MNRTIVSLRGTIFTNKIIIFSPDIVSYISSLFDNEKFVAIINNVPLLVPNVSVSEWSLQSVDKTLNVVFSFNKIDIVKNGILNEPDINTFLSCSKNVFVKMMGHFNFEISRLAFAPTYKTSIESVDDFSKKVFNKVNFSDASFLDCSFNNTFIKKELLNKDSISVNYCCNVSTIKNIPNFKSVENKDVLVQIDVNTNQLENRSFSEPYVIDFYDKSNEFSNQLYEFYFSR